MENDAFMGALGYYERSRGQTNVLRHRRIMYKEMKEQRRRETLETVTADVTCEWMPKDMKVLTEDRQTSKC